MDPVSITASVASITTAAIQVTQSLYKAVKRFNDRNKTLRRLHDGLQDLVAILKSLEEVANTESAILDLLKGPISRCSQECHEFEQSLPGLNQKQEAGIRDWAKMEFKRGDINDFIENLAGYKATITIGLGTITMHNSRVSQQVLQEYNEMIKDAMCDLQLRLRRIDTKMTRIPFDNLSSLGISVDLANEREVTEQCLGVCEEALSYLGSLASRESTLLGEATQEGDGDYLESHFKAQLLTRQALGENQDKFVEIISKLRERLESQVLDKDHHAEHERLKLQGDIKITRQCLEVCKAAGEMSSQKIYRVGEVVAKGDSDQIVVNTLADLFDVKKALSQDNARQMVGSMTPENFRHLTESRYGSHVGASTQSSRAAKSAAVGATSGLETQKGAHDSSIPIERKASKSDPKHEKPSSNETRKRATNDGID